MYVRITRTDGLYDRDIVIDFLCTGIIPAFQSVPGYRGLTASADPVSGAAWTISVWDDPDTVRVTDELSEHLRETWLARTHRQLRGVEVYDVVGEDAPLPGPTLGCILQILPFTVTGPDPLGVGVRQLEQDFVPALAACAGIQAVRLLVGEDEAGGMVLAVWADAAAARAGYEATAEARARVAARGVHLAEPAEQEIVLAHVLTHTP